MNDSLNRGLLPAGLRDGLPPEAEWEAEVTERLMADFAAHAYARVKPPLLEFEETLLAGSGAALAPDMFRLMDPVSQRMLGLRPDMTLQVARIAETRLADVPRPLRLSYAGQILRIKGTQLRPERQFGQVGVELIGAKTIAADLEVIAMAAEALARLGVKSLSIDLTQPMFAPAICAALGFNPEASKKVRRALDQKDAAALAQAAGKAAPTLLRVMAAAGPAIPALKALRAQKLGRAAGQMIGELDALVRGLTEAVPDVLLTLDPGEFRGIEYQSGISFTFYARGVRGELGRGGRYISDGDAATGFTLYLDSLLRAVPPRFDAKIIYLPSDTASAQAAALRAKGYRTLQAFGKIKDIKREARQLGCTHIFSAGKIQDISKQ